MNVGVRSKTTSNYLPTGRMTLLLNNALVMFKCLLTMVKIIDGLSLYLADLA
ncbi:hypothetical protein PILCRDRAFT_289760 [Piloderma croceum F 1598]|uniref:Uncharacterized protein n=1 Tax=Piloderma croceum (strain F 1598) TaxID=765440 RepID=A0A0C3AJU9_PILCF|nr:hypothetical protein PILCRDRAFT_711856 [Piloderma croceum F 1598]KIM86848.1 hypothetical protein PILCRDRAFT_289760 [Piloderma croceum F 1598]